jgi:hypothetical protein
VAWVGEQARSGSGGARTKVTGHNFRVKHFTMRQFAIQREKHAIGSSIHTWRSDTKGGFEALNN